MAVDPEPPPSDAPDPDDGRREPPGEASAAHAARRGRGGPVVGWVVHEVGLSPLLVGPAAATALASTVGTGAGGDAVDAFVSLAVFAVGVAAFVAVLRTRAFGRLSGWPLAVLAGCCLVGGLMLSTLVHMAAFSSLPATTASTGTPLDLPAMSAAAAAASWGPTGAAVSIVSGVLAGVWGVRFRATLA